MKAKKPENCEQVSTRLGLKMFRIVCVLAYVMKEGLGIVYPIKMTKSIIDERIHPLNHPDEI